jgi:hypothetical protein
MSGGIFLGMMVVTAVSHGDLLMVAQLSSYHSLPEGLAAA